MAQLKETTINGNLVVTGSIVATQQFDATASFAVSASYAPGSPSVSASYAVSASWAPSTGTSSPLTTGSSYPITSSWAENAATASKAVDVSVNSTTANFWRYPALFLSSLVGGYDNLYIDTNDGLLYNPAQKTLSGSGLVVSASFAGSLTGTSSWATNATTASYTQYSRPKTLVVSASFSTPFQTDGNNGEHYRVILTDNITLAKATASYDGQRLSWELIQDTTGTRTITLDTAYITGSDLLVELNRTGSKRDFMTATYNQSTDKWYVIGFLRGY